MRRVAVGVYGGVGDACRPAVDPNRSAKPQSCRSLFARLSDYLDGVLQDDFCAEIQKHLTDCPPCVAFLASLEETIARCRQFRPTCHSALSLEIRRELMTKYKEASRPWHKQACNEGGRRFADPSMIDT